MHPLHSGFTLEFDRDRYLYHYTSMDKAISYILKNKTLRFSSLANVNDPMESNPDHWAFSNVDSNNDLKAIRDRLSDFFKNRTKVVCFSRDDQGVWGSQEFSPLDYCARGHSKPRMWATYGDEHKGVCLIFDKERLRQAFQRGLNADGRMLEGAVRYGNQLPADENQAAVFDLKTFKEDFETALQRKIEDHHSMYFFYKYIDWSTENEYRFIITEGKPGPVDIAFDDALVGVVVGTKFETSSMNDIGEITQDMGVPSMYLNWGWRSAQHAPLNEAAKQIGPRVTRSQE